MGITAEIFQLRKKDLEGQLTDFRFDDREVYQVM